MNCEHCGARLKEYWHSLTPGLLATLIKFARFIKNKKENKAHVINEVSFTINQCCNFQKLKYFGLVAKWVDEEGGTKSGYWVLTKLGVQFLRGEIFIPKKIKTFRGSIVEKSQQAVKIGDIDPKADPYWEKEFDFEIHH